MIPIRSSQWKRDPPPGVRSRQSLRRKLENLKEHDPARRERMLMLATRAVAVVPIFAPITIGIAAVAATPDFTRNGNPQITVTLQRTDLPMFFARIWGSRAMTVTASATAEAYNASSSQTSTGSYVPITPKCVKPLLVANWIRAREELGRS